MVKIRFKKLFLSPENLMKTTGIKRKILRVSRIEDEIIIEIEGAQALSEAEREALLDAITRGIWIEED